MRSRSTLNGRKVIAPVLMVPGHPDGAVTVHLGLGARCEAGRVARALASMRTCCARSDAPLYAPGAKVTKVHGDV